MTTNETIPEDLRRAIFKAVVDEEDRGTAVVRARSMVAAQFQITTDQVREIEDEGVENTWPPLESCDEEDDE